MSSSTTKTFQSMTKMTTITRFQCEHKWTIRNLKLISGESRYMMRSSPFSAAENTCKLFLEVHVPTSDHDMELYLEAVDSTELKKYGTMKGEFQCSLVKSDGGVISKNSGSFRISSFEDYFQFDDLSCSFDDFLGIDTTICCSISYVHELDFAAISDQFDTFLSSKVSAVADFEKLFNDEKFSDVTVYVGGKKFPCHKNILAARSSVFEAMLTHDMKEKNLNRIDIDDMYEDTFQEVLRYIYTGKVENIEKIAFELLFVADKYDLAMLKTMCENEILKTLTVETLVKVLKISNTLNLKMLKTEAIKYIQTNLKTIIGSDAWNYLISEPDLMKIILESYGK